MNRDQKAIRYKQSGCNCCQAVLCAFADQLDIDETILKQLGAAFGMGMGGMEGNCGALISAQMILGMKEYQGYPINAQSREILEAFKDACGAITCKDLKGLETGEMLCSCNDCIRQAVALVDGQDD